MSVHPALPTPNESHRVKVRTERIDSGHAWWAECVLCGWVGTVRMAPGSAEMDGDRHLRRSVEKEEKDEH